MSEEKILGFFTATKRPGTFVTDAGSVKKEENPFINILVFTSKRLICIKTEEVSTTFDIAMFGAIYALLSRTIKIEGGEAKRKELEEMESLNEVLKKHEHYDIDYSYIEDMKLSRRTLKIKVSWNPRYLDKELVFSILGEHKSEDCAKVLHTALSTSFSETFKDSFLGKKYQWKRAS